MTVQIGSESSIATPAAGYRTLFINTDKNNQLYWKNSDGTFTPYTGDPEGTSSTIAADWIECLCCALKNGSLTAEQYQSILDSGLDVTVSRTTVNESTGDYTSTVSVGSRIIALTGITLNSSSVEKSVAQTHQIEVTFSPTNTTNQQLAYISSNEAFATVNSSGLVSCVGAGTVVITVIPLADPSKAKTVTIIIT